jgi:general secretion pathway protein D
MDPLMLCLISSGIGRIKLCLAERRYGLARLALVCLLAAMTTGSLEAEQAKQAKVLFKAGQTAEMRDDVVTAYEDYFDAFEKDPTDLRYKTAYARLKVPASAAHVALGETLQARGKLTEALTEFLHALAVDPSNELAQQDITHIRNRQTSATAPGNSAISKADHDQLDDMGPPVRLSPASPEPLTLHMTEDSRVVYQTIGKAAGVNVLFDPEYTSKRIQIDLANVSLMQALHILATVSGTFWRPLTGNTIFVAMNTRAKRQELEEEAVQTFYLANAAQQNELNDVQTALRNLLVNTKLYGVPSQNAIVMRGTPDELLLARKVIQDLDKARPEIIVDVALLEVNRDKTRNIGLSLPTSFATNLQTSDATTTSSSSTTTTSTSTENLTLNNLAHLNATNFAVTVGSATANLLLSDSDTKVMQNPSIRVTDGQKADLKIGERIPVATGSYSTGTSSTTVSTLVNTQFTYIDVGVEIEMTPVIHYDRDSTLKIKIVSSEESGTTTISGVTEPIISQRTTEQVVRLRDGEVNILGGFMQKSTALTVSGWPGLGEVPLLKYFFSSQQREVQDDEIVFMITPHIVRATEVGPENLEQVDTGTGANIELRRKSEADLGHPQPTRASSGGVPVREN